MLKTYTVSLMLLLSLGVISEVSYAQDSGAMPISSNQDAIGASAENKKIKLQMPRFYSDNMVLQRDKNIVIYGKSVPGDVLQIKLGDFLKVASADENGEFKAEFPALKASAQPIALAINSDKSQGVTYQNILIGDVWYCTGQSNMYFLLKDSQDATRDIPLAENKNIRIFEVPCKLSPNVPKDDVSEGEWKLCTPESIKDFSAVAYYFGRDLNAQLDIPIGLIAGSWGGTPIESWMSKEMLAQAGFTEIVDAMNAGDEKEITERFSMIFAKWLSDVHNFYADKIKDGMQNKNIDLDDSQWQEVTYPGLTESQTFDFDGGYWVRKRFDAPADAQKSITELYLGDIDDTDEVYINGQFIGHTGIETPEYWAYQRRYKIPAGVLKASGNVIAIHVEDHALYSGIFGNKDSLGIWNDPATERLIDLSGKWKFQAEYIMSFDEIEPRPQPMVLNSPDYPATLFNAMINPFLRFNICGVIYYQGESNVGAALRYEKMFKALIQGYRQAFNNPKMPFLFVQLAGYETDTPGTALPEDYFDNVAVPKVSLWAELREAQLSALDLPYCGMASAVDLGDPTTIHPLNKQDVGVRLAHAALAVAYGQKIVHNGVIYESMKIEDGKIVLTFKNAQDGLVSKDNKPLTNFAVAGDDGVFHWAHAVIVNGNEIEVSSPEVKNPKFVRYAWSNYANNLNTYSKSGLPLIPFRTGK